MQTYAVVDFETFSKLDLKKAGAWEYSRHPSTEVLCLGYRIGTRQTLRQEKTKIITKNFQDFFKLAKNEKWLLVAHNALFEQVISRNTIGVPLPVSQWICTASLARSVGLPGKLADAGAALGLPIQKDMEGHRLMLKLSKPRKPTKNNPSTRVRDPESLRRLFEYCKTDVDAETELFLRLPRLTPLERNLWILDQRMNLRGFAVDRELIKNTIALVSQETKRLDDELEKLTGGQLSSARQNKAMLDYLTNQEGLMIPNMQQKTIQEWLRKKDLSEIARKILDIRSQVTRSSTAKYTAFEIRSRSDGRARDNTIFFGAHTGRQSGTGLQPQNLFKSLFHETELNAGLTLLTRRDHHAISAVFRRPMDLYASALRSCIIPAPGHVLDVGDFATIEVRVLFWLAGNQSGLDSLAAGKDLYIDMASKIFGTPVDEIKAGVAAHDPEIVKKRQLGKHTVLGAGFGIGVGGEKFQATCKQFDLEISKELAQKAVKTYREMYPKIPGFWSSIEKAAVAAVQNPGSMFRIGRLVWFLDKDFLKVKLPIDRNFSYFQPKLEKVRSFYGEQLKLSYMGVDPISKKFVRQHTWGGKLTENVVQAVARDLLMCSLLRLESEGISKPVLAVHDEIVAERQKGTGSIEVFLKTMAIVPDWAQGLPIKVAGWAGDRYKK